MEIKLYENWMQPQVNRLFSLQYGRTEAEVAETMDQFYEHPFQKEKCIRLVAMDGDVVTGFQSLFYWPYQKDGKVFHSFQSGNSLVHPDYRGKGIFQKLLNYLDEYNKDLQIDFLMGFPVQMSYGSFMKNRWVNPFNIQWKLKIINPLGFLFSHKDITASFDKIPEPVHSYTPAGTYRLLRNDAFENWINASRDQEPYCFFHYREQNELVRFALKVYKRSRWMNELIIGDIRATSFNEALLQTAFQNLISKCRISFRVSVLTIALNEKGPTPIGAVLAATGFMNTNKSIYFITKSYTDDQDITNPSSWELYRSDVDTW